MGNMRFEKLIAEKLRLLSEEEEGTEGQTPGGYSDKAVENNDLEQVNSTTIGVGFIKGIQDISSFLKKNINSPDLILKLCAEFDKAMEIAQPTDKIQNIFDSIKSLKESATTSPDVNLTGTTGEDTFND